MLLFLKTAVLWNDQLFSSKYEYHFLATGMYTFVGKRGQSNNVHRICVFYSLCRTVCVVQFVCFAGVACGLFPLCEKAPCTEPSKLLGCVVTVPYHSSFGELSQGIRFMNGRKVILL